MSYCDLEGPKFYRTAEPVAAKTHKCCECSAPINVGERHVLCVGLWDFDLSSFRQHTICAEACEFVRDVIKEGDCLPFGGLSEFWREEGHFGCKKNNDWAELRKKYAAIIRRERMSKYEQ